MQAVQQLVVLQQRPDRGKQHSFFDLKMSQELDLGQASHPAGKFQRLFPGGFRFQPTVDEDRDRKPVLVLVGKRNQARIPVQGLVGHGATINSR